MWPIPTYVTILSLNNIMISVCCVQLCVLKWIEVVFNPSHARIPFTNVTLQLNLIHFLIKITYFKAITFRRLEVSLSSVKVEGLTLINTLDKKLSGPLDKADWSSALDSDNSDGKEQVSKWNGAAILLSVEEMYEVRLEIVVIHSCYNVT